MSRVIVTDTSRVTVLMDNVTEEGTLAIEMDPDAAEELAQALILCAKAARGFFVDERDKIVAKGFRLT